MKILITGGHPAPALAIVDAIRSNPSYEHVEIIFVGKKYNNEREKSVSFEYKEITSRNIQFIELKAGRLTRSFSSSTLSNIRQIPCSYKDAVQILKTSKPDIIVTFGGYIALPIAIAGRIRTIPVYLHEQTIQPGLAASCIGYFATKVFVSFPATLSHFSKRKTVITGNPVRKSLFHETTLPFLLPSDRPIIYVTGGSLGSHSVNYKLMEILPELLKLYTVVHQTGNVAEYHDYEAMCSFRDQLPKEQQQYYQVREHFTAEEVGELYRLASLIICRSGANTVFELIAFQKPAVLVPLPWSARQEQQKQAEMLAKAQAAEIYNQSTSSLKLLKAITRIMSNRDKYELGFTSLRSLYQEDAAECILKEIFTK